MYEGVKSGDTSAIAVCKVHVRGLTESSHFARLPQPRYGSFAWVAAYCVSPFGAAERAWKPFNPILGETFELEVGDGVRYLAEQVSHHPPICAAHAENSHFRYDLVSAPTTRFLGNSLEVYPYGEVRTGPCFFLIFMLSSVGMTCSTLVHLSIAIRNLLPKARDPRLALHAMTSPAGRTRITLNRTGEVFTLVPPNAMVNNIVIGRTWVDAHGPMTINCITTGAKCRLDFKPCGWFGYGRYEFEGYVFEKGRFRAQGHYGRFVDGAYAAAHGPWSSNLLISCCSGDCGQGHVQKHRVQCSYFA